MWQRLPILAPNSRSRKTLNWRKGRQGFLNNNALTKIQSVRFHSGPGLYDELSKGGLVQCHQAVSFFNFVASGKRVLV